MLRSFWCWFAGAVTTIVLGTLAIATSWIPPRGRVYVFWARLWSRVTLHLSGIPVRVETSPAAAALPAAVFMPNHESVLDTLALFVAIRHDVRFLAKRALFYIPILGWSMWLAGFIPVDRERKDRAREVLDELAARIRAGLSVLVFPEGTRSRTGQLGTFKKSGFLLALRTGLPIVPVGISGARDILGADGFRLSRGLITVRVGDPIPTAGLGVSHRRELMERVRAEILRLSGRPAEETVSRSEGPRASESDPKGDTENGSRVG